MAMWNTLLRAIARFSGRGLVLFGHGFSSAPAEDFVSSRSLHIPIEELKGTVEFCRSLGFEFVSMEHLMDLSRLGFPSDRPWIHLTFDDGYESNHRLLYPYLRGEGIPWTVFVSTYHASTGHRFYDYQLRCAIFHARVPIELPQVPGKLAGDATSEERKEYFAGLRHKDLGPRALRQLAEQVQNFLSLDEWEEWNRVYGDERPITKEQLMELARDPLVHIGSHCHHHVILNGQASQEEVRYELSRSRTWLETEIGVSPVAFCYPNGELGQFSQMTRELLIETGYRVAFTTVRGDVRPGTDPYEVPRRALAPTARKTGAKLARTVLRSVWPRGRAATKRHVERSVI